MAKKVAPKKAVKKTIASKPLTKAPAKKVAPKKAIKTVAKKVVKPVAKKVVKVIPKKTTKPVAKKIVKVVAKKVVRVIPKKVIKPVAKKLAKPVAKKVVKVIPKKVTQPVAKKLAKPVAKKVVKVIPKKVTKPVAKKIEKPAAKKLVVKPVVVKQPKVKIVKEKPVKIKAPKIVKEKLSKFPSLHKGMRTLKRQNNIYDESAYAAPQHIERPQQIIDVKNTDMRTRYNDDELQEFYQLIDKKLVDARKDFDVLKDTLSHKDDHGTDDTSPTFKLLEDGGEVLSREETAQLAQRQQKFIEALEHALIRVQNKTYGICRVTGRLISKERLRSVPHATLSVEAKIVVNNER